MNLERFEETLSRLGGDLTRWPATDRAEAEALIAAEPRAAKLRAEAAALDALIGRAVTPVAMDAAQIGRIMAGIDHRKHRDLTLQPTRRLFAWAGAAMVVFLVAGFAAGEALPSSQGDDTLAGLMFGSSVTATTTDSGSVL
jgi:hypothetical protein